MAAAIVDALEVVEIEQQQRVQRRRVGIALAE
jgi:hypothetical protein